MGHLARLRLDLTRFGLVVAGPLLLCGVASAISVPDFEAVVVDGIDQTIPAAAELAQKEPEAASAFMNVAVQRADQALADLANDEDLRAELRARRARALRRKLLAFKRKSVRSRDLLLKDGVKPLRQFNSIQAAARAGRAATRVFRRIPALGATLEEVRARSAGFHGADRNIVFRVRPGVDESGEPCLENPVPVVVNSSPGTVVNPTVLDLGGGRFGVTTGPDTGAARVEITACNVTRRWLIYNYGKKRETFAPPPVTVAGSWSGGYRVNGPNLCSGIRGAWQATFAVDPAGNISGNWSGDGWSGAISGRMDGREANFAVSGSGDANIRGTVRGNSISGGFTGPICTDASGRTRGTFSGSRN